MFRTVYSAIVTNTTGNVDIDLGPDAAAAADANGFPRQNALLIMIPNSGFDTGTINIQQDDDNDGTYATITGATITGGSPTPGAVVIPIQLYEKMRINEAAVSATSSVRVAIVTST